MDRRQLDDFNAILVELKDVADDVALEYLALKTLSKTYTNIKNVPDTCKKGIRTLGVISEKLENCITRFEFISEAISDDNEKYETDLAKAFDDSLKDDHVTSYNEKHGK